MSWRRKSARLNSNVLRPVRIASANCGLTDNKTRVGIGYVQQPFERLIADPRKPTRDRGALHEANLVEGLQVRTLRQGIDEQEVHHKWSTSRRPVPVLLQFR